MTYAVDLGKIKFNWQGNYNAATTYARDDVVYHNGSAYVCIVASSVNQDPTTNTAQWNKMAQGSDLGALSGLAANDLIYYDGTDFQRLPAGTQDQILSVGSSGLQWIDNPKRGIVKVQGVTDNTTSGYSYSAATVYAIPNLDINFTTTATNSDFICYVRTQIDDSSSTSFGGSVGLRYSVGAGTSNWVYVHWPDQHSQYQSGGADTYLDLDETYFVTDINYPAGTVLRFQGLVESHNVGFRFFNNGNNGTPKRGGEMIIQEYVS